MGRETPNSQSLAKSRALKSCTLTLTTVVTFFISCPILYNLKFIILLLLYNREH